jgi:fructuronate reductase
MIPRLDTSTVLPRGIRQPGYQREELGAGILHLGLGAFHRAHQAVYTDDALARSGGDWRITGVSLRSSQIARDLNAQDGLYTCVERGEDGARTRVIGALSRALSLTEDRAAVLSALTSPSTRIVSLTVTEKGYGLNRATGGVDIQHLAISADLARPAAPIGVAGLLTWALARRRQAGVAPFAVLSCDNLPENGRLLRGLVIDFARRTDPQTAEFISTSVSFPSTMVDRITPAVTPDTLSLAESLIGAEDRAAIACETFSQWVVEDRFPTGRPDWEAGGALFVEDVCPYEEMKLRMLNGTHSMLAYAGFLSGHAVVRDVMRAPLLAELVRRHLHSAARTLDRIEGIDLGAYASDLARRFANPHLAHETSQIAMDGSEKLPQRIFAPALAALEQGQPVDSYAFATAAWMRFTLGRSDTGVRYDVADPLATQLVPSATDAADAASVIARINAIPGVVPSNLAASPEWQEAVQHRLHRMIKCGMSEAVRAECESISRAPRK